MPTIAVSLTNATVVDIKADQSLVDGKSYLIQARGGNILMSEQASAPTIGSTPTHLLENDGAPWTYIVRSGEALFAWAQFKPCFLIVTEAG